MSIKFKNIKILTIGPIPVRGFYYGPILTPYKENVATIFNLLTANIDVYEVLDTGEELKLTLDNYSKDNNNKKVSVNEPVKNKNNVEDTNILEKSDKEVVVIPSEDTKVNNNYGNKHYTQKNNNQKQTYKKNK